MTPPALPRRRFLQLMATAAASAPAWPRGGGARAQPAAADDPSPLPFETALAGPARGPWRRLFLDAWAVEEQQGLTRVFHAAEKHPANPVLKGDQPWESVPAAITGPYVYGTAAWDGGKLRLWYQILNRGNHVGYAESADGIHWTKPALGLIEFNGSKANNLCVSAAQPEVTGGECHNPGVLRCPEPAAPHQRYALFGFDPRAGHARVAFSPDGRRWKYVPETEKKPLFSSSDVVNFFYDPGQKRYTATWKTHSRRGRAVGIAWSPDGLAWTKPYDGPLFAADDLDPDATQIYGMPVFPCQGLYIGLPWIYRARYFKSGAYSVRKLHEAQEDSPRTLEVQLAWSWDLINWTRAPGRPQFIPLGAPGQWDRGMIVTARAPVPVGDRLHFYYGGCDGLHDDPRVNAAIGLATLRLDGFCSFRAGDTEGWLISRREPFRRPAVTLNARVGTNGCVAAEILDRHNRVLPGFAKADCIPFEGDSVRHELRWRTAAFAAAPERPDYKIRFWLRNADLFSYLPPTSTPRNPTPTAGPPPAPDPRPCATFPDKFLGAMIAVLPLPGAPRYGGDDARIIAQALSDVAHYHAAGVDALVLENSHDLPYIKPPLPPRAIKVMQQVADAVRRQFPGPIGLQMLEAANETALEIAGTAGLDFLRVEGYVFAHVGGAGLIEGCAGRLLRRRRELGVEQIKIFGDVKKKHCSHALTGDLDILDEVKQAEFFLVDGVIVTGARTTEPPALAELQRVQEHARVPVLIGSGITPENLAAYFPRADGFIVGSTFRQGGRFLGDLEPKRLEAFMRVFRRLRAEHEKGAGRPEANREPEGKTRAGARGGARANPGPAAG